MSLLSIAARHNVALYDAEGFDLDDPELRAAVIAALASRTDELFATVERLAAVRDYNLYAGECRAAETALRFALVDLDSLKPTLGEMASAGDRIEKAGRAA